jgi:SAM-dependent methyltransferase
VSDHYVHGFSEEEQRRLTLMQEILNDAELAAFDLGGARRILDVGSGLGQFSRSLARRAGPPVTLLAVEKDARQIAAAERQAAAAGESGLVEFRRGSADRLPLAAAERGSFDLAHARFLLEHVTDPLAVVREMVAALRPGGRLVLVDDDHELLRLWPDCDRFDRAWRTYWESFRDHGLDPLVGRKQAALIHEAGACPTRVSTVFYGAVRGATLFDRVVDNLIEVVSGTREALDRSGRLSHAELEAALDDLERWRRHPAATLWYSLPLAEGRRPPAPSHSRQRAR